MIEKREIEVAGKTLPLYVTNTVIVGSGAAGLNCGEYVYRYYQEAGDPDPASRVVVVTSAVGAGTSNNSGSDKQTYYRLGVCGDTPDTPLEFAKTLTAGGCCHGDNALLEGENSLRAFYHLVENGVPFPHDSSGLFVGYKTDHDPRQRATSAGPWTSRFMVQKSLAQLRRFGVPLMGGYEVIAILTAGEGEAKRTVGVLAVEKAAADSETFGLTVFAAANVVMATGGPGDMYEVSVYPHKQMGSHGLMFEAGVAGANLTESQFGIASVKPRWNLSGTYQQVIPHYFSTDADGGDEQPFLNQYFTSMKDLTGAVFLKGYQWPFDPDKASTTGSSLVDLAVHAEFLAGRRVFMDFTRNPVATGGLEPFSLDNLPDEAARYLEKSGANQALPIERLAHMNQPSIDLYTDLNFDITTDPLEIAVCSQHCNGGFAIDRWWETSVGRLFCVGELSGAHGVKRPGGSALNSTQVGGLRAAQRITHVYKDDLTVDDFTAAASGEIEAWLAKVAGIVSRGESAARPVDEVKKDIQHRMTAKGGFCRGAETSTEAVGEAEQLYGQITGEGMQLAKKADWLAAVQVEQMCLAHWGYLTAIREMIVTRDGGSRGSHMVMDPAGFVPHPMLAQFAFKSENESLRDEVLEVSWNGSSFLATPQPVRPFPAIDAWFENTWNEYMRGDVFRG